jgi:ATP-binding cassette subfamily F protein uup
MNVLSLENVSKDYGFKPLFQNVTIGVEELDKIGIIGAKLVAREERTLE